VRSSRDFFNDSTLGVLYGRGGEARTVGTFLSLEYFVSSKPKYLKIRAARAFEAPARQGKRYLTVRRRWIRVIRGHDRHTGNLEIATLAQSMSLDIASSLPG